MGAPSDEAMDVDRGPGVAHVEAEMNIASAARRAADLVTLTARTDQSSRRSASQRQINLIWERTQAGIAVGVVVANIVAAFFPTVSIEQRTLLQNAFFLVIGFYFGRTNHARPDQPATGVP